MFFKKNISINNLKVKKSKFVVEELLKSQFQIDVVKKSINFDFLMLTLVMFKKTATFNNFIVNINIFDTVFKEQNNEYFFGFPISNNFDLEYNNYKGSWIKIKITSKNVEVVTDIIGAYRLYYTKLKDIIYISDNYQFLLEKIKKVELNEMEYEYWKKHDYTTGGNTLFKKIKKFKPATVNKISSLEIEENLYFKDLKSNPNELMHTKKVFNDLNDTFSNIKKNNKKIVLMFSGGKDSCLLALFLIQHKINFVAVFLKIEPTFKHANLDFQKVTKVAEALNIKLKIIKINLHSFSEKEQLEISLNQLMDKHFTPLHYIGVKKIKENYGKEILIVNGSTSDSIFTFGPSESSIISYLRRNMMFKPKSILSKIGIILLNFKTKKHFKIGKNKKEQLLALMDEYRYCRVLDTKKTDKYYNYLSSKLFFAEKKLTNYLSLEMYAKTFTFLQGSTQQIVNNSCKYYQIKSIMPFASPNIIYATMQHRVINLEIKKPKYCVENILLSNFKFNYNDIKINYIKQDFEHNLDELRNNVTINFENSLKKIFLTHNI